MSKPLYKVKKQPHSFVRFSQKSGLSGFQYCDGCGLVALKNEASQKAINKPCIVKEDVL